MRGGIQNQAQLNDRLDEILCRGSNRHDTERWSVPGQRKRRRKNGAGTAAKKYYAQEKRESKLQKALNAANKIITELKNQIESLTAEISSLRDELFKYKSIHSRLNTADLTQENDRLRSKLRTHEDVISRNNLWHLFSKGRVKTHIRDDSR